MNSETENTLTAEQIPQETNLFNDSIDIKRPPNAFIIFYKHWKTELLASKDNIPTKDNIPSNEIDRMIGKMWQMADEETKANYREQAKQLSELFKQVHPESSEPRKRKNISLQSNVPEPIQIRVILNPDSNQEGLLTQIQEIQHIQIQPQQISSLSQENEQTSIQQNQQYEQPSQEDPLSVLKDNSKSTESEVQGSVKNIFSINLVNV